MNIFNEYLDQLNLIILKLEKTSEKSYNDANPRPKKRRRLN